METYRFEHIEYQYPGQSEPIIHNLSFGVNAGEFIVVCGPSGSGKSTLLRSLKEKYPDFAYVMQNPTTQIVTDNGYHELAFGMENAGIEPDKMRQRIAETATYFGIEKLLTKGTHTMSGGEKQLLNLAAAMMEQPEVVLLDEPTAQLDPMAATEFLEVIKRIHEEMGMTIILVEQRLDEVLSICNRMMILNQGKLVIMDSVEHVYENMCHSLEAEDYFGYMPSFLRFFHRYREEGQQCPTNVKESRQWFLNSDIEVREKEIAEVGKQKIQEKKNASIECKEIYFRYERNEKDVLKGVNYGAIPGLIYGIAGGNGSGKSTLLKIISGCKKAYHGTCKCKGKIAYLPQEPKYMFLKDKVRDIIKDNVSIQRFGLEELLERHPYDISGGQMQRLAMAMLYEKDADIYLFDEPTKGLDPYWKEEFQRWLEELKREQKTIVLVSHDVEFVANTCDVMSMCFQGEIDRVVPTTEFFQGNYFYTTSLHKIVRERYPKLVSERFLDEE